MLSSALRNGSGVTTVTGSLNSLPSTEFTIQLFLVLAPDGSGHGEGQVILQQKNVTTNSGGDIGFSFAQTGLAPGQQLTTTATNVGAAETSEFSANITVVPAP